MKNRKNKILSILNNASNPKVSRLSELHKLAGSDQHGIFQHFQSNVADYTREKSREKYLSERGGEAPSRDTESLYNLSPEHKDSKVVAPDIAPSLSTRYSPDRVGVQARRIGDGIMQDPFTNKIYDYNEGFKTEDGREFPGGSPALQTDIMNLANHLDDNGLIKEANWLDGILKKAREFTATRSRPEDTLSMAQIADVLRQLMEKENISIQQASEKLHDVDAATPWVRDMLGLSSGASERESRALTISEIVGLMKAHEDPTSAYKLNADRLAQLNNENLTEEEAAIVDNLDTTAGVTAIATDIKKSLMALSNSLDEKGLYKEADRLDALLKI